MLGWLEEGWGWLPQLPHLTCPLASQPSPARFACAPALPARLPVPPGVRSNLPTSEPGVSQRAVYSWSLRLQGGEAGQEFENCWMTESVQPISQSLL